MDLVTVGIPVYNASKYLSDAINSVLKQSYTNIELLIINDGSTDDSVDIVSSFDDPRIRFIDDKENRGLIFRLNQMIDNAKGDYFARMDADDIMFLDRIEKQLMNIKSLNNTDIIYSDAISIDHENNILGYKASKAVSDVKDILKKNVPMHPTIFAKTSWFRKNKYSSQYLLIEDYELFLRTVEHSNFTHLPEPLLFYREISNLNANKYLNSIPSVRRLMRTYHLPFVFQVRNVYLNYLKYLYHLLFEKIGISRYAISYRFLKLSSADKKYYSKVLNNISN